MFSCSEKLQSTNMGATLEFNMPALTLLLRRQSEQNPTASYFNVDILKYTVKSKAGAQSCPFQLVSYWKCEPTHTDIKIDYKYNSHSMASPSPLLNVSISVPVDGGVKNVQSKPHSAWWVELHPWEVWSFMFKIFQAGWIEQARLEFHRHFTTFRLRRYWHPESPSRDRQWTINAFNSHNAIQLRGHNAVRHRLRVVGRGLQDIVGEAEIRRR